MGQVLFFRRQANTKRGRSTACIYIHAYDVITGLKLMIRDGVLYQATHAISYHIQNDQMEKTVKTIIELVNFLKSENYRILTPKTDPPYPIGGNVFRVNAVILAF